MQTVWNWTERVSGKSREEGSERRGKYIIASIVIGLVMAWIGLAGNWQMASASELTKPAASMHEDRFPTVPPHHVHVRALLENALRYVAPESHTIDPVSGYLVEGWNDDREKNLCLRCFTQLTAIGQWMELLANVIAGHVEVPYLTKEQALSRLEQVVASLRADQKDPQAGAKGLLGNFLDLASGKRLGLLASEVEKRKFLDAFGPKEGEAVWQALKANGWLVAQADDQEAAVRRGEKYGWNHFDGVLKPYSDDATRQRIMAILDQRVVMVVFGDNANLSSSVAKTIGALLHPAIKDQPKIRQLREEMEHFLEDQREGYAYLYDTRAGLFCFGWDATRDRLFGWADAEGKWQAGYMDYLVNEFRGPATFVVLRYDLPADAIKNLGFKMKSYRTVHGNDIYALAPWEGSAFQSLGLGLSMMELKNPSWRQLLENVVSIQLDYAYRKQLPGFLSESYTGEGPHYTGDVGIPDIAVTTMPRITETASLYTLGVAYMIAPQRIEQFLAANWSVVSKLLTDHGPWEGFHMIRQEPIEIQTSAHTLSLILGIVGTGSEQMDRYLESRGYSRRLPEIYKPGEKADFLAEGNQAFAWAVDDHAIESARDKEAFRVRSDRGSPIGVAFVSPRPQGVSLSGGMLDIRYRSAKPIDRAVIGLKPAGKTPAKTSIIPTEVFVRFADTHGREEEIQVPLPATPGLGGIKEVVITAAEQPEGRPIELSITRLAFTPFERSNRLAMEGTTDGSRPAAER